MFQTNSPVSTAFRYVSVCGVPQEQKSTVGGSHVTFWNWLNGAMFRIPVALTVEIQPIGLGTQHEVNGLCGKPDDCRVGS